MDTDAAISYFHRMKLYLLRHGEAEDASLSTDDRARRLTDRGRARVRDGTLGMQALKLKFDAIMTSSAARASETAEIVSQVYGGNPPPRVIPELAPGVTPVQAVAALKPLVGSGKSILVVGHEPALSAMASLLITGSSAGRAFRLKKSGAIAIKLPNRLEPGTGVLSWMLTARQLRRLGK